MNTMPKQKALGVIVARFQIPNLHDGHKYLVNYVLDRHDDVLIILGVSSKQTDRYPLSFEMRKGMIESTFPGRKFTIVPSASLPSSQGKRSENIDRLIRGIFPGRDAVIYGSRDSVIHAYNGAFDKVEVPTVFDGSATNIRESIPIIDSADFRSGVIHTVMNRPPIYYPAVDVAVIRKDTKQVLLVSKREEEGRYRFPGVFFDPRIDNSYEKAAIRCIQKEIPGIKISDPKILSSHKITDWRYRKTRDGVITLLLWADYIGGEAVPGKGVDGVHPVDVEQIENFIVESHLPLAQALARTIVRAIN